MILGQIDRHGTSPAPSDTIEENWIAQDVIIASKLACVTITPFGSPVEPEVYMITAIEDGLGGVGSFGLPLPNSII